MSTEKNKEIIFPHSGKQLEGILAPENSTIGVSNRFIIIDASLENIKIAFIIPPQIVDDISSKTKTSGKRNRLYT